MVQCLVQKLWYENPAICNHELTHTLTHARIEPQTLRTGYFNSDSSQSYGLLKQSELLLQLLLRLFITKHSPGLSVAWVTVSSGHMELFALCVLIALKVFMFTRQI